MTPSSGMQSLKKSKRIILPNKIFTECPSPPKQIRNSKEIKDCESESQGDHEDYVASLSMYNSYSVRRKSK